MIDHIFKQVCDIMSQNTPRDITGMLQFKSFVGTFWIISCLAFSSVFYFNSFPFTKLSITAVRNVPYHIVYLSKETAYRTHPSLSITVQNKHLRMSVKQTTRGSS